MKVKKPNRFIYFTAYGMVYPLLKILFRLEVNRKFFDLPKGPFILLANHSTMLDFLFTMLPLFPKRRVNAVTAQKFFLHKPLHKALPAMGCIPKKMFDPDVRSIVGIKNVLKRGGCVLLFPEGRITNSMAYAGMHKSTGKLLKKLGVPVVSCFIEGGDVCIPHWRRGFRLGKIRVTYRNLFSADDLSSLSVSEINAAVDARLSGAQGGVPARKPYKTLRAKKLAEGLSRILYYCPRCECEFTLETKGNTITCKSCGYSASMDRQGLLTPVDGSGDGEHVSVWFAKQTRFEMRSLDEDKLPIIDKVTVRTPSSKPGDGTIVSGAGIMTIDRSGWQFDGELHGEKTTLFFPVESVPALSYSHHDSYQIYFGGDYYTFAPDDPKKCIKYVVLAECLHRKFANDPLMTAGVNSGFAE